MAAFSLHADRPQKFRLQRLFAKIQRLVLGEVSGPSMPMTHSRAGDISVIPAQPIRPSSRVGDSSVIPAQAGIQLRSD